MANPQKDTQSSATSQWFCKVGDQEIGPMSAAQLQNMAHERKLTPVDLVRRGTAEGWVSASKVRGLNFGLRLQAPTKSSYTEASARSLQAQISQSAPPTSLPSGSDIQLGAEGISPDGLAEQLGIEEPRPAFMFLAGGWVRRTWRKRWTYVVGAATVPILGLIIMRLLASLDAATPLARQQSDKSADELGVISLSNERTEPPAVTNALRPQANVSLAEATADLDLVQAVAILKKASQTAAAIRPGSDLQLDQTRNSLLRDIAVAQAKARDIPSARATIALIATGSVPNYRGLALAGLAAALAESGDDQSAEQIVNEIDAPSEQVEAMVGIGKAKYKSGDRVGAAREFTRAVEVAKQSRWSRTFALEAVLWAQAEVDEIDAAMKTVDEVLQSDANETRTSLLQGIAVIQAKSGRVEDAIKTLDNSGTATDPASLAVVQSLVAQRSFSKAQSRLQSISHPSFRIMAVCAVATAQGRSGDVTGGLKTLKTFTDVFEQIPEEQIELRGRAQAEMSGSLAELRGPAAARVMPGVVASGWGPLYAAEAARRVADSFAARNDRDRATEMYSQAVEYLAQLTDDNAEALQAYRELGRSEARASLLEEVTKWANTVRQPATRAHALLGAAEGSLERLLITNSSSARAAPASATTASSRQKEVAIDIQARGGKLTWHSTGNLTDVATVDLSGSDVTDSVLADLMELPRLQRLSLRGKAVSDSDLRFIEGLTGLLVLDVAATHLTDEGVGSLVKLTNLRLLDISATRITPAGLLRLSTLKQLYIVNARGSEWVETPAPLDKIPFPSVKFSRAGSTSNEVDAIVKDLRAQGIRVTIEPNGTSSQVVELDFDRFRGSSASLRFLRHLTEIRDIDLSRVPLTDKELQYLGYLSQLKSLSLGNTAVSDVGMAHVCKCSSIETLSLNETGITDAGLRDVRQLGKLSFLNLNQTKVSDACMRALSECRALRTLAAASTGVTDEGLKSLVGCQELEELFLSGTKVSDNGLVHLAKLPNLAEVSLSDTSVTKEGVARLKNKLPALKVRYTSNN